MNAVSDRSGAIAYDDSRPLILIVSSDDAANRARVSIDRQGIRVGAVVRVSEGRKRLTEQAITGAVWVEVDEDADGALEELIYHLRYDSTERRYGAVVSTSQDLVDRVISCLGDSDVEVIVDPDEAERDSAVTVATKRRRMPDRISDVARDRDILQLRQLTEEINRIAAKLARLSAEPASVVAPAEEFHAISPDRIRKIIRARRSRFRYFPEQLFADPAWDMLLDLLHAQMTQVRVPVSSLCIAAGVPATTALRWLKTMVSEGLIVRRSDPHDGRRVFVELTPEACTAMQEYFADIDNCFGL